MEAKEDGVFVRKKPQRRRMSDACDGFCLLYFSLYSPHSPALCFRFSLRFLLQVSFRIGLESSVVFDCSVPLPCDPDARSSLASFALAPLDAEPRLEGRENADTTWRPARTAAYASS